jgi:hypothetical protein
MIAAGILLRSPAGRVLLLHRTDGAGWSTPGGTVMPGETLAQAAIRETYEETAYRADTAGQLLTRRVKDDVDYSTFLLDCPEEFTPQLDREHDGFLWATPAEALAGDEGVEDDQPASPASTSAIADHGEVQELVRGSGDPPELTQTHGKPARVDDHDEPLGEDPLGEDPADIAAVAAYLETLVTRIDARLTAMERQRQEDMARGS